MNKPPKRKSAGDIAYEIGRATTAAVGPLQVLFENIFSAPLEKRKQAWLEQLAGVVDELQKKMVDLTPEKLASNEAFITTALQASQIAIRNHQQEKIQALRNAVMNSALPNAPEEDEQIIFLRLIDQLTPTHLRVLTVLDNCEQWMARHGIANPGWGMGGVATVLQHCLPELRGKRDLYDQIVRDLRGEGLTIQGDFLHVTMTGHGMLQSRTSERGKRFIRFISKS